MDVDEFDRRLALYEPLACSVRELLDATIRTCADEETVAEARRAIDAVTAKLRATQTDGPRGVRFTADGRSMTWSNPVIGVHNAIAPPLEIHRDADLRCWSEFELGAAYEGPPGHVHGGMSALILDHILGEVASARADQAVCSPGRFRAGICAAHRWDRCGPRPGSTVSTGSRRTQRASSPTPTVPPSRPRVCSSSRPGHVTAVRFYISTAFLDTREVIEVAKGGRRSRL